MPAAKRTFLLRTQSDGRCHTLVTTSERVAVETFVISNQIPQGEYVEVKERGVGEWSRYKVGR